MQSPKADLLVQNSSKSKKTFDGATTAVSFGKLNSKTYGYRYLSLFGYFDVPVLQYCRKQIILQIKTEDAVLVIRSCQYRLHQSKTQLLIFKFRKLNFKPLSGISLCFTLLETAVYWRADKILGFMDHNPFWVVERTFSIFQLLLF